jgi:hypothetical protein
MAMFYYLFAWAGVIINAIAVVQAHNLKISTIGPLLGVVGNALYSFTAVLALSAVIINIISAFFIFMQHDNKKKA